MCGIAGAFMFEAMQAPGEVVSRVREMGEIQRHRGPDGSGVEVFGPCVLASQRLSILDLTQHGHMPMCSDDGRLALVYNGEIYNYLELRAELRARGRSFKSEGDTEVVLCAYQEWGLECVERFVGMWAFALYDTFEHTLVLSRDRFGIKPLYTHATSTRLIFASEIKALVSYMRAAGEDVRVDEASLATYVITGQVDGGADSFFAGVKRFPPANIQRICPSGVDAARAYWSLPEAAAQLRHPLARLPDREIALRVRQSLAESVRMHLRSDVPTGVCLSGGLDSSAVVALAAPHVAKVNTFTVYFPDGPDFDERQHAHAVAEQVGAESREMELNETELVPTLEKIAWHLDEPSLAPGVYPQWHVMQLARKDVKVVLDGQGGDEVFGGYLNYLQQQVYGLLRSEPWRVPEELLGIARVHGRDSARRIARGSLASSLRRPAAPDVNAHPYAHALDPSFRSGADVSFEEWRLWPPVFDDWLTNVLYWEMTRTRLPALLRYEDRLSMAFSLESRVPFLDHRLVELAFALPGHDKVRGGWSKFILRKALHGALPSSITWRRDKRGFPTPVGRWFRDERGTDIRNLLRDPHRRSASFFPLPVVESLLARHESGAADESTLLWRILSIELWMRAFHL